MTHFVIEGDFPFWRGFVCEQWKRLPGRRVLLSVAPALWRPGDYDAVEPLPLRGAALDLEGLRALAARHAPVVGVTTLFEPAVGRTVEVQRALGLPELTTELDPQVLRNKAMMVEAVRRHGLGVPRTVSGSDPDTLVAAARMSLAFPMVIKPAELAGKAGVRLARDADELDAAVRAALAETLPFEIDGRPTSVVELFGCRRMALVQEYVDGPEFSVEGWTSEGRTEVLAVTEKLNSGPPLFEELGHLQPARIGAGEEKVIREYARAAAEAFGLANAFFHLELRLAAGTPVLMEMNCRLGGDFIARLLEWRSGMNTGQVLLALAEGGRVDPPARLAGAAGVRMAVVGRGGTIRSLRPPVLRHDRELAIFERGPGDAVAPPKPGGVTRVGAFLAAGDSPDAVASRLAAMAAETEIEIDSV